MILFLAKGLALLGVDLQKAQRIVFWSLLVIGLLLILGASMFVLKACNKSPKLDQQEIQKAQEAIAKEDRKVMVEILTNSDVREQAIDSNIKQAEEATNQAKQNYTGKTNEELAAELERRLQ